MLNRFLVTEEDTHVIWGAGLFVTSIMTVILVVNVMHVFSTTYTITESRLIVQSGMVTRSVLNVELAKIRDTLIIQSLDERLFGRYMFAVISSDSTRPVVSLQWLTKERADEIQTAIQNSIRSSLG